MLNAPQGRHLVRLLVINIAAKRRDAARARQLDQLASVLTDLLRTLEISDDS